MAAEDKLKTTIYLMESVLWMMRETAVKHRISTDSAAMEAAVRYWHTSLRNQVEDSPAFPATVRIEDLGSLEPNKIVTKLLCMLIGILLSERDDAVRAIGHNIEVYYRYIGGDPQA